MQKKILQVTGSLDCAGIETLLMNVLKNIDREKFKIDFLVVANKKYFYSDMVLKYGSKIYTYVFKEVYKILIPFFFIKEIMVLLKHKYDIVHCHFYFSTAIVLFLAWLCGVKKRIAHSHNTRTIYAPKFLVKPCTLFMQKIIRMFATDMVACSQEAGIALFGKQANFKIVKNGINKDYFKFNKQIRTKVRKQINIENNFVLGHAGRFDYQKNHIFLINVFKEVLKYNKNAVLLLIGVGMLEQKIKQEIKNLNMEDKVKFLGISKNINELYQAMDVFLLPSLYEGLPIAGVEAQASGLPCFFSQNISNGLYITNSFFLPLDAGYEFWAKKIIEVSSDFIRKDTSFDVEKSGYDLKNTLNAFEKLYN